MDLNFGLNGSISVQASRPISVASSTPIAIVGTANGNATAGLYKFNNADDGLEWCETNSITEGTIRNGLKGISLQGVNCPIVVSLSIAVDEATDKTNILAGLDDLKSADAIVGVKPDLITAPIYSFDVTVGAKMDAIASQLWGTAVIDVLSTDEADAVNFASNFGSRHCLLYGVEANADGEVLSPSCLMAGLIALKDSEPFGWAKSHSNYVVKGVSGTARVIEYVDGSDCEARRLRQNGVGSIVKDIGWRSYGFETTDIDPIWQSLERVRAFYRMLKAILEANKWARDRSADQLIFVKQSCEDFFRELKGNGVVIGFECYFDPEKNTNATVTAGKFYLTLRVQNMPSIRELNIELVYADDWGDTLINYING